MREEVRFFAKIHPRTRLARREQWLLEEVSESTMFAILKILERALFALIDLLLDA